MLASFLQMECTDILLWHFGALCDACQFWIFQLLYSLSNCSYIMWRSNWTGFWFFCISGDGTLSVCNLRRNKVHNFFFLFIASSMQCKGTCWPCLPWSSILNLNLAFTFGSGTSTVRIFRRWATICGHNEGNPC